MQLFDVTIEETRTRRVRVVARNLDAAAEQVRADLRHRNRSARVLHAVEAGASPLEKDDRRAFGHLLACPFLDLGRDTSSLAEWIAVKGPAGNTELAHAGLRLDQDGARLFVANSPAFGYLRAVFENTPWAGGGWATALRRLPGATVSNFSFRGMRSRCAGLPINIGSATVELAA